MFQKNTSGEARVGARDGYNRMVSTHMRLFPHNISENHSYSLPSTIRCTSASVRSFSCAVGWPKNQLECTHKKIFIYFNFRS